VEDAYRGNDPQAGAGEDEEQASGRIRRYIPRLHIGRLTLAF
jgi:hypothetical protein